MMFTCEITKLKDACLHHIGSGQNDTDIILSNNTLGLDEKTRENLIKYCFSSFKEGEIYHFYNELGLEYNEIFNCIADVFDSPDDLLLQSREIAKFLHLKSGHHNIKGGDLLVVYFSDCEIDGVITDGIGLFKSETKTDYLTFNYSDGDTRISTLSGIDLKSVDKAALIFNIDKENGYAVAIIDNTNRTVEAKYWVDDFLCVRRTSDDFSLTQSVLRTTKKYVTNKLAKDFNYSKAEQAAVLNRSLEYFKNNKEFELDYFANHIIEDETEKSNFQNYLASILKTDDSTTVDSFHISDVAVRKQSRNIRSVIKLDKNFHIYIHGDERLIKRGYDEETGMTYYQIYFNEEH